MSKPNRPPVDELLPAVIAAVHAASREVMLVYERGQTHSTLKADASPVTEADERAEAVICQHLEALLPGTPIVAEEAASAGRVPAVEGLSFWLVDPLDGTKEFLSRNGEFTVNVAWIEGGVPVLGVVAAPAIGMLWAGVGHTAFSLDEQGLRKPLRTREVPEAGLTVMGSRSHGDMAAMDRLLQGHRIATICAAGSSLKLCRVAEGAADIYPRLGRTMEWDIAAGHAVLRAAGGEISTLDGSLLRYGKPGFDNPHFVAHGRPWKPTKTSINA